MANPSGFKFDGTANGWSTPVDLDDVFVRSDAFYEGGLWTWGNYPGDNTILHRSSPVQTIAGGTNWKQVSNSAAIKTDGTLWLWGSNTYGTLGDNSTINKSSPVQTIAGGNNWKQVAAGGSTTLAIKIDGTLWAWGYATNGVLGDNSTINKSSPVQTADLSNNWKQVATSGTSYNAAAIRNDGTLWTWGYNGEGQLGNNTGGALYKSSPVQTATGGTNWKQVAVGYYHIAAIKTDGTLWTWGRGDAGELGNNSTSNRRSTPAQTICATTDWKQIACSTATYAIKTDGTLWTWGSNSDGALGDGTSISRSSPVQTIAGGTNWKQVSAFGNNLTAIKTDGTLWANGNWSGVSDNTAINRSSPVQIGTKTDWRQVSGTAAIRDFYN